MTGITTPREDLTSSAMTEKPFGRQKNGNRLDDAYWMELMTFSLASVTASAFLYIT